MRDASDPSADGTATPTTAGPRPGWHSWLWLLVLIAGELGYQALRRVALHTENPHLLPGMVLMGALIVPCAFVAFLWGTDIGHEITLATALITALAGGCVAVATAAAAEDWASGDGFLDAATVAAIEEAAKLAVTAAALVAITRRAHGARNSRNARNGLVLGAACGAGFAVVETLGYTFVDYLDPTGGGMQALDNDLLVRSIFAPATHLTWAALTGCAVGAALSLHTRSLPARVVAPAAAYLTSTALHGLWDHADQPFDYLLLTVVGFAMLASALRYSTRRPRQPRLP